MCFLMKIPVINNSHVGKFSLNLIYRENWNSFHSKSHHVTPQKETECKVKIYVSGMLNVENCFTETRIKIVFLFLYFLNILQFKRYLNPIY